MTDTYNVHHDIYEIIDAERDKVWDTVEIEDYSSPAYKIARVKGAYINDFWMKVSKMNAAPRKSGDVPAIPILEKEVDSNTRNANYLCPSCGAKVGIREHGHSKKKYYVQANHNYCPDCGQYIDWESQQSEDAEFNAYPELVDAKRVLQILAEMQSESPLAASTLEPVVVALKKQKTGVSGDAASAKKPVPYAETTTIHVMDTLETGHYERKETSEWDCPNCGYLVSAHDLLEVIMPAALEDPTKKKEPCHYCPKCGQRIDWASIVLGDEYEAVSDSDGET